MKRSWIAALVALLPLIGPVVGTPRASGHSGLDLTNFATAALDGVISDGEYGPEGCADPVTIVVPGPEPTPHPEPTPGPSATPSPTSPPPRFSHPDPGPATYHVRSCETNDSENNYYAFSIDDLTPDPQGRDAISLFFDDEHDGTVTCAQRSGSVRQDALRINVDPDNGTVSAIDLNYCTDDAGNVSGPIADATTPSHVLAAFTFNPGAGYVIEVSHPLISGDPDDYELEVNDTVGFCFVYDDFENDSGRMFGEVDFPQSCFLPTVDAERFGDIYEASGIAGLIAGLKSRVHACTTRCRPDAVRKLEKRLGVALQQAASHDDMAVSETLKAFVNKVESYVRSGKLSKSKGRTFTDEAEEIRSTIDGQHPR